MIKSFKYYHGTSTIFIDSIKRTGLGAINPNTDWKTLDLLKYLSTIVKEHIPNSTYYKNNEQSISAIINQNNVEFRLPSGIIHKFCFQHKNIYIALSSARAVTHATINKYGSEILEICVNLYNEILEINRTFQIPSELNIISIEDLSKQKPEPVIIEISNVSDNDLMKEDGEIAIETLDILRNTLPFMTEKQRFECLQYYNFELLRPILPKDLIFYKLKTNGFPGNYNFKYDLIEI